MEIEIDSKKNNPLLNRTEICFTVRHEGGSTPNREIIRSELAEKLNVKKENIIVNTINTSFGIQETTGYAKIYSSVAKAKDGERRHILKRNLIGVEEKKKEEKKTEAKSEKEE
ncbi:30S ribosomal protein S24e [candidate division WOR-3 bacterium]|nr:30S ribosomal protein S24e [candidate division WOR-3 bacterium]